MKPRRTRGACTVLPEDMRPAIMKLRGARVEEGQTFVGSIEIVFSKSMVHIPDWAKHRFGYTTRGRIYSKRNGWFYSQQAARALFGMPPAMVPKVDVEATMAAVKSEADVVIA